MVLDTPTQVPEDISLFARSLGHVQDIRLPQAEYEEGVGNGFLERQSKLVGNQH